MRETLNILERLVLAAYLLINGQAPESPSVWAVVEILGHRRHVGRVTPVRHLGAPWLRVEELQRDGGFVTFLYPERALFAGPHPMSEDDVRAEVLGEEEYSSCKVFSAPSARPGRCAMCGADEATHQHRVLIDRVLTALGRGDEEPDLTLDGEGEGARILDVEWYGRRLHPDKWALLVAAGLPIYPWAAASSSWSPPHPRTLADMLVSVLRPGLKWNECAHLEREWETAIESWSPEERREVMTWIGTRDEVAKPARVEQLEAAQSAEEVSHV